MVRRIQVCLPHRKRVAEEVVRKTRLALLALTKKLGINLLHDVLLMRRISTKNRDLVSVVLHVSIDSKETNANHRLKRFGATKDTSREERDRDEVAGLREHVPVGNEKLPVCILLVNISPEVGSDGVDDIVGVDVPGGGHDSTPNIVALTIEVTRQSITHIVEIISTSPRDDTIDSFSAQHARVGSVADGDLAKVLAKS